jgi:hypothetical protein
MLKPTEKQIRAILNLEGNVSFEEIIDWINESLISQSIANNHAMGELAIKGQGRNLELEEILKHIKNSRTYQKNLKQQ